MQEWTCVGDSAMGSCCSSTCMELLCFVYTAYTSTAAVGVLAPNLSTR